MEVDIELYRREVRLSSQPLVRLSVIDIAPEQPQRTFVFVHGFGGNARQWRYQLQHFCGAARVIAPDLRGHGLSDKPRTDYSMPSLVADLHAALGLLAVTGKFVLVGHSFGGAIASEYAAAHPERVERLILIAAAGEYRIPLAQATALRLPTLLLNLVHSLWVKGIIAATPHVLQHMHRNAVRPWNGWELFRRLTLPTLVIRGDRDRVLPVRAYADVVKHLPDAEEADMGASAHMVMLERRDAVNRVIERFVGGGPSRRAPDRPDRRGLRAERAWLDHYDSGVPYTLGLPAVPIHRLLRSTARRFPLHAAIRYQGNTLTYRRLNRDSSRFANLLRSLGIQPGDRVLLLLPNLPQTIIAYYGTLKTGATVVFTTPFAQPEELARQVRDSGARVLVTLTRRLETARAVQRETQLEHVILTNVKDYLPWPQRLLFTLQREARQGDRPPAGLEPPFHLLSTELYKHGPHAPEVEVQPQDVALIQYTSGTTSQPKGVMLSHRNLLAGTRIVRTYLGITGEDRILSVLPFSFDYGLNQLLTAVEQRAVLVVCSFKLGDDIVRALRDHAITGLAGVPTLWAILTRAAPLLLRTPLPALRYITNSGGAVPSATVKRLRALLGDTRIFLMYGLTEAFRSTYLPPEEIDRRPTSIGKAIPECEVFAVTADGRRAQPGEPGILVHRGPTVSLGYWKRPEDTARVLRPHPFRDRAEGGEIVCYSGDLVVEDEDGFFTFVGRDDAMIKSSGYRISPTEVEEAVMSTGLFRQVAVIGLADAFAGQRVHAVAVPGPTPCLDSASVLARVAEELPAYMVPREIELVETLPVTANGKIDYRELLRQRADHAHG
jgi:acyl-CoA ligase (AMP-forming) (exosortase A-associated)